MDAHTNRMRAKIAHDHNDPTRLQRVVWNFIAGLMPAGRKNGIKSAALKKHFCSGGHIPEDVLDATLVKLQFDQKVSGPSDLNDSSTPWKISSKVF